MKRDSHGRFVADSPDCQYEFICTDRGDRCASCANRRKKSYYIPDTLLQTYHSWLPGTTYPGTITTVSIDWGA